MSTKNYLLVCVFLLVTSLGFTQNPIAHSDAMIMAGQARFTVLRPEVIRMEWDAEQQFEDRASFTIVNRQTDVPDFEVRNKRGWLVIRTDALELQYKKGSGQFSATNLKITLSRNGEPTTWMPD
ncbi:MAG: glycosyl hydrolase family 31, partial [Bacteroidota bacterium]